MADTAIDITPGTGASVDTRTESTNGNHRQVVVLGDPAANAGVAPVDATTGLKVNLGADNAVTITGAVLTDDAAFTPATSKVMMAGYQVDDTATDSVDEGDAGAARMSANRNQYIQLRDAAGNERGANINASNQLAVAGPVTNAGTFAVQAQSALIDVTLSTDTSAYAADDLLADTQAVTSAFRINDGTGVLQSIQLLDEDDQGVGMDLIFLSANNTLGTENSAPSVSDANARDILGRVNILAGDYIDLGGCRIATKAGIGLLLKAASGTTTLYVAAVTRGGSPTYTASGLRLRLGILQD